MSGQELNQHVLIVDKASPAEQQRINRAAAVHIADRIAAEHPGLTAAELAADPVIAAGVRELLDAIGIKPDHIRRDRNA